LPFRIESPRRGLQPSPRIANPNPEPPLEINLKLESLRAALDRKVSATFQRRPHCFDSKVDP
jgi:hypothetical protein